MYSSTTLPRLRLNISQIPISFSDVFCVHQVIGLWSIIIVLTSLQCRFDRIFQKLSSSPHSYMINLYQNILFISIIESSINTIIKYFIILPYLKYIVHIFGIILTSVVKNSNCVYLTKMSRLWFLFYLSIFYEISVSIYNFFSLICYKYFYIIFSHNKKSSF